MAQTNTGVKSGEKSWLWFVILLVGLLFVAALRWMLAHPHGIHADEAFYINEAQSDINLFHSNGLHQLFRWIIHGDPSRPPAYRLAVLPFTLLTGYHAVTVRLVIFACYAASGWFIYLTTKRLGGVVAGAIAVLVFCLSPEILQGSIFFSTEGPLYLAIAGTFYFLSSYWNDSSVRAANWIGLGLAIGLGLNAKITFVAIAGPLVAFTLFRILRNRDVGKLLLSLAEACTLSLLVAVPWWRVNFRSALAYGVVNNRQWIRHSLGEHSPTMLLRWFETVFVSLLGPAIGILIVLILFATTRKLIVTKESVFSPVQRTALFACACAALPIIILELTGTNFLLRLISPVMIPLAIAIGILVGSIGWGRSKLSLATTALLFFAQFLMLVYPVLFPNNHLADTGSFNQFPWRVMIRFEQWDWKPLREISNSCQIPTPKSSYLSRGPVFNGQTEFGWSNKIGSPRIAYLGNGRAFNGSQIQNPWIAEGDPPPDVAWIWRYEDGPIDWQHVLNLAAQSDVVITAPKYVGQSTDRQDLDNQNNAEFATRLSQDSRFQRPIQLEMGQLDKEEVYVFVKKNFVCQ